MTDKELKDWCKTCNVEPPAMKFKCPECEHNPDKEQIIIDGVNIIDTIDEWARLVAHEWGTDEYSDAEIVKNYILDINKQLARKTQEYNELTLQIRETQEYSDTCAECKDDIFTNVKTSYSQIEVESRALAKIISSLKSKTQECEQKDERIIELTKENKESQKWIKEWNKYVGLVRSWITQAAKDLGLDTEHSFGVEHFTFAVRCLKEEHEKLKQECEEKQKIIEELKKEAKRISANYIKDEARYRKALEEIEGIAKNFGSYAAWQEQRINKILDIINKAKGEE